MDNTLVDVDDRWIFVEDSRDLNNSYWKPQIESLAANPPKIVHAHPILANINCTEI